MIFASLMLTMSTCLSCGCNDVARNLRIDELDEKTTTMIDSFNNLYNLSDYNLSVEDELTLFKCNLMSFAKNNNLLQDDYCHELEEIVTADSNYDKVMDYQKSLYNNDLPWRLKAVYLSGYSLNFDENGLLNEGQSYDILPGVDDLIKNYNIKTFSQPYMIGKDMNLEMNIGGGRGGGGGGTNNPPNELPTKEYSDNNVSITLNGKIEGCTFLGLICSRDACIKVYNEVASKINEKLIRSQNGDLNTIRKELLKTLISSSSPIAAYIAVKKSAIISSIVNFFKDVIITVASSGVLGKIFVILCAIVIIGVVAAVIAMVICGYYGFGYAIGWKIKSLFD